MINWSKFKEASLKNGKRILKVMGLSLSTADECMPFGDDSCPLPNMLAIYAKTSNIAEPIIIGYINKNQLSGAGEKRLYSLNPDGSLSAYMWLRANKVIEINGNSDNLVRYQPLKQGIDNKDVILNSQFTKIATAIASLGGVYVPDEITTDISGSKIEEVKCASGSIPK